MSENAKKFLGNVLAVGTPALAYGIGSELALERTRLTGGVRAVAKAGVGVLLGVAIANKFPRIGSGLAIGGLVAGGQEVAAQVRFRAMMAQLTVPANQAEQQRQLQQGSGSQPQTQTQGTTTTTR